MSIPTQLRGSSTPRTRSADVRTRTASEMPGSAREDAEFTWFEFHDLRHKGFTLCVQQGPALAELLHHGGHRDVGLALR